jgi:WD40 repeat protein
MARRKKGDNQVTVGDITSISGEVNIAGGNIGYTAKQVTELLKQINSTFQPKPFDGLCPYKGLDVFEEEDAKIFFGRERLVEDLVGRVKESRVVFVTGPSGSGKSSLVRAGLIPALMQGAIPGSDQWQYATLKPGRDPIGELARAASRLAESANAEKEIREGALNDPTIFSRWCEIALGSAEEKRAILFLDQFEEIFTQKTISETDQIAFLNLLTFAGTSKTDRIILLLALRSDFISNCATYPELNALLNRQLIQIGAMQPDELVGAIALPALHVGLRIDPDLIAQIINDMRNEPGALPLMQFALKDLFDAHQERDGIYALTLEDYLRQGGIYKALQRHADRSFAMLNESEQQLARSIFSSLVEVGHGTPDARRMALFDEIVTFNSKPEDVLLTVRKLADARLITTDKQAGKDTITISHEKLIDAWPWLKKLIDENREGIALQNEITSDANKWEEHKKENGYLYTGARLANARAQIEANLVILNNVARSFIEAGVRAHVDELEAALQRTAQLRRSAYLTAALVLALVAAGLAVFFGIKARQQANISLARQLAAQAQSIAASKSSKQNIAVLLSVLSMQMFPTLESAEVIQTNLLAYPISNLTHDGPVYSIAFSPDGKYVVSGSYDRTARVWEATTGKEIARMTHDGYLFSVAFSPDSKYVVSSSEDGTSRVWEAVTGQEVVRMTHDGYLFSVAFSPDGKYVVSGSEDRTARVWEAVTGQEVVRMAHDGSVNSVAFSLDSKYVVSSVGETVRVWETTNGQEVASMTHDGSVNSVAFSPDGKYVVSGSYDSTARVREATTGQEVARMTHDGSVYSVAFSPNAKYVVSGGGDKTARVWEAVTGQEVASMTHDGSVYSVAFSPDGRYVFSHSWDGTARALEVATGQEVTRMTHDSYLFSLVISPDGKYVVSGSEDNTATVLEAITGQEVASMTHDGSVNSAAFSPDGKYVVSGSEDNTACVWEAVTGQEVARMTHDGLWTLWRSAPMEGMCFHTVGMEQLECGYIGQKI